MSISQSMYKAEAKKFYQQKELEKLGLTPEDDQHEQIVKFLTLLHEETVVNGLLTMDDLDKLFIQYFIDSIQPLLLFGFKNEASVLTLASGVGFPAIPIAIFRPDLQVTMAEDDSEKRDFLKSCVEIVGVENVSVVDGDTTSIAEKFDYVVQRDVENLQSFTRVGKNVVTPEGRLYTYRTEAFEEELGNITMNKEDEGVCVSEIAEYDLANQVFGLNLVAFELF